MPDVFVSYARPNEAEAAQVTAALRATGFDVWRDDQLPVHRAYGEIIEERLNEARAVVVLWSAEAARSEWVRSEANRAREGRKLVQLSIDGAPLPMPFDQIQCADLRGWSGDIEGAAWQKVLSSVTHLVGDSDRAGGHETPPSTGGPPVRADDVPQERVQPSLPQRLITQHVPALVGRLAEQALLMEAWKDASEGRGRVVLLGGEPGIGKTSLASEAAILAHGKGATVLFGHCDEDVSMPYRPFVDAFRHYVAQAPREVLARHAAVYRGQLARLVPELSDRPATSVGDGDTERFLLFEAATGLMREESQDAPVLLMIDDLHWASPSDLLLFKHLARAAPSMRLLILATFRDSDIDAHHALTPLLADLRRESGIDRIALRGIDRQAVVALIAASGDVGPGNRADDIAEVLVRDTAGNPFFIGEMIRNLSETGWVHGVADQMLPDSVKEVIERRLGRLSPDTAVLLSFAAVIGRQFDPDLLERVAADQNGSSFGGDRLLDALDEAIGAALIAETGGPQFQFKHDLVRSTLYTGMSGLRRRRMHRRIAATLEADTVPGSMANIDALAHHWLAGADGSDMAKAIGYARRAGDNAAASLAFETAASHYESALAVLTGTDNAALTMRCDLLLDLGGVQRLAGDLRFRETMAAAAMIARRFDDGRRLALAALGSGHLGSLNWSNAVDPELVALYGEALAALGNSEDALRVRLMGQLAIELRLGEERQRRHDLTADAVALARQGPDTLTLAQSLSQRLFAIDDPSTLAERLALAAELEELAATLGNGELGCLAASHRFDALFATGDVDGAEQALRRCEALAARLRVPFFAMPARLSRTMLALTRVQPDAEEQIVATVQAGMAIKLPHATNIFASQMFELRTRQGRLSELIDSIRQTAASFPDVSSFRAALIFALCETGAMDEARALMTAMVDDGMGVPLDMNWSPTIHFLSEACGALGDARAAAMLYPVVEPFAGQVALAAGVRCDGSRGHAAGLLAHCLSCYDDAERHFEAAIAVNDRIGAKAAAVATRRAFVSTLLTRGDRLRAGKLIDEALALAAPLDLVAEIAKLESLRLPVAA